MGSFSGEGIYLNFRLPRGGGTVAARGRYGKNYERLVQVKTKYDPGDLFRPNANIEPRG
jgi:Berberine and berberine like